jgi:hypothetical protein
MASPSSSKRKPKTVPLGAPLDTTDDELDLIALVTIQDIEDAKATAAQRMTPRGRALLETDKTDEPLPVEP